MTKDISCLNYKTSVVIATKSPITIAVYNRTPLTTDSYPLDI